MIKILMSLPNDSLFCPLFIVDWRCLYWIRWVAKYVLAPWEKSWTWPPAQKGKAFEINFAHLYLPLKTHLGVMVIFTWPCSVFIVVTLALRSLPLWASSIRLSLHRRGHFLSSYIKNNDPEFKEHWFFTSFVAGVRWRIRSSFKGVRSWECECEFKISSTSHAIVYNCSKVEILRPISHVSHDDSGS